MNTTRQKYTRSVTCRECSEKQPDCGETCEGHWCHEDMSTGASGCGYGPPALPFYYRGPELFYYRSKVCITLSRYLLDGFQHFLTQKNFRGAGKPRRHCVCSTNMCNTAYNYQYNIKDYQYNIKEKETSLRSRSLSLR